MATKAYTKKKSLFFQENQESSLILTPNSESSIHHHRNSYAPKTLKIERSDTTVDPKKRYSIFHYYSGVQAKEKSFDALNLYESPEKRFSITSKTIPQVPIVNFDDLVQENNAKSPQNQNTQPKNESLRLFPFEKKDEAPRCPRIQKKLEDEVVKFSTEYKKSLTNKRKILPTQTQLRIQEDINKGKIRNFIKPHGLIILPDDSIKSIWGVIIICVLIYTLSVTPYRIAFYDDDPLEWIILDNIITGIFSLDIIINFLTAYFDDEENLIINKKMIAQKYLKSWLIIDLIGILPLNYAIQTRDYNSLVRISRLPRLYRLMKLTKMVRMLKLVKERNVLVSHLNDILKLSVGIERLFYFALIFLIICHISACLFYLLAKMEEIYPHSWILAYDLVDASNFEIYSAGFYFTISNISTVGLGGLTPSTTSERYYSIFLMVFGLSSYAFMISSLTTVITSMDSRNAKLKEKLGILNDIKGQYQLNNEIYLRLRKALRYDHNRDALQTYNFLKQLPHNLKLELSYIMHRNIVEKLPFFQNKPSQFVASVGPLLRPLQIMKGEYIYEEGDPINEIYFLVSGEVGLVLPNYDDVVYVKIEEGNYFGEIDFFASDAELAKKGHRRHFTVKALEDCEILTLNRQVISNHSKCNKEFLKVFTEFPDILNRMVERGAKLLKKSKEIRIKVEIELEKKVQAMQQIDDELVEDANITNLNLKDTKKYWKSMKEIIEENKINQSSCSSSSENETKKSKQDFSQKHEKKKRRSTNENPKILKRMSSNPLEQSQFANNLIAVSPRIEMKKFQKANSKINSQIKSIFLALDQFKSICDSIKSSEKSISQKIKKKSKSNNKELYPEILIKEDTSLNNKNTLLQNLRKQEILQNNLFSEKSNFGEMKMEEIC